MSVVDAEPVDLDAAVEQADHATLRKRLERLRDALDDTPDHYSAQVKFSERLVFVTISSSESWTRQGELGTDRFRVTFGPHGGLKTAAFRDEFCGYEVDYAETKTVRLALRRIDEQIRDAK